MFASMSTVRGDRPDLADTGRMAAEAMLPWLKEFEGYRGLLLLTDEATGTARILTLWESKEAADRSEFGRFRMRDGMIASVGMELEGTESYTFAFLDLQS